MRPSPEMALSSLFNTSELTGYGRRNGQGWTRTDDYQDMDPGMGLPHPLTFAGLIRGSANTYHRLYFDEAWRHSQENAHAMLLDEHLGACFQELFDAILKKRWHLEPDDKNDPVQAAICAGTEKVIRHTPYLQRMRENLLWAKWYGRQGSQCQWEWRQIPVPQPAPAIPAVSAPGVNPGGMQAVLSAPVKALCVKRHLPVNGDKIGYTWDHHPMVRINGAYADRLKKADVVTDNLGWSLILRGGWRERFIIHTHRPFDADFFHVERQDAIHGMGDRSWLYFSWWTVNEYFASVIDAIERYGLGFIVITYQAGNKAAFDEAQKIAKTYSRRALLTVPRYEGDKSTGDAVQVVETPTAGMQILMELGRMWLERQERYVIGQTLSSDHRGSGGLGGSGAAEFQATTKHDRVVRHAQDLAESLTGSESVPGLVSMVWRYTYPWAVQAGLPMPRWVVDEEEPDLGKIEAATAIVSMGGQVKEEEVLGSAGLTPPGPGDRVLGGMMAQPAPGMEGEEGGDPEFSDLEAA